MSVKTDAIELAIVEYTEDDAQAEAIRAELVAIKAELAELDRLRALLASGQCVDLAKVEDQRLMGEMYAASQRQFSNGPGRMRRFLIDQAGVKLEKASAASAPMAALAAALEASKQDWAQIGNAIRHCYARWEHEECKAKLFDEDHQPKPEALAHFLSVIVRHMANGGKL